MFENQNGFVGYPYAQQPQYQAYTMQPQQVQKVNNYLSAEQIKSLTSQRPQFTLAITEEQKLRAICNHRSADGMESTLQDKGDGTYFCPICGYTIKPIETNGNEEDVKEVVKEITQTFLDLVQTIKLMFVDMPQEAAELFYGLIPLIEKTPELYDMASKSFSKYDLNNLGKYQNSNPGTISALSQLMGMMGSNPFVFNSYQPQQQPIAGGNPAFGNAFGYPGAQQQGYQPMTNGFVYNPAPTAAPAPEAAPATTTTTANLTV